MIEKEIDYHGSKSNKDNILFVKEQRVDGSWCGGGNTSAGSIILNRFFLKNSVFPHLRYTLVGFERNYQVKILSNPINLKRNYSKQTSRLDLNP